MAGLLLLTVSVGFVCLFDVFVFFKERNTTGITFQVEEILTVKSRWEEAFEVNRISYSHIVQLTLNTLLL